MMIMTSWTQKGEKNQWDSIQSLSIGVDLWPAVFSKLNCTSWNSATSSSELHYFLRIQLFHRKVNAHAAHLERLPARLLLLASHNWSKQSKSMQCLWHLSGHVVQWKGWFKSFIRSTQIFRRAAPFSYPSRSTSTEIPESCRTTLD